MLISLGIVVLKSGKIVKKKQTKRLVTDNKENYLNIFENITNWRRGEVLESREIQHLPNFAKIKTIQDESAMLKNIYT